MSQGCQEYNALSRRSLLSGMAPAVTPKVVYHDRAITNGLSASRDVLVTIYLRGGCDGLSVVAPFADPAYYSLRPTLAIPRPDQTTNALRGIALDSTFAVPQAMSPILPVYEAGDFAVVHATGSTDQTRSHFDAQFFMEAGKPEKNMTSGWVGRHLASISQMKPGALLRGVGLSANMAMIMQGAPQSMAVPTLEGLSLGGEMSVEAKRKALLQRAYESAPAILQDVSDSTMKTVELLRALNFRYDYYVSKGALPYNPNTPNGNPLKHDELGESLKAAAALIRGDVGVEAIHIDMGSWDTHDYQDPLLQTGEMYQLMWSLSSNLAAFWDDMRGAGKIDSVTVVVMSEFGRTARENGVYGTDHGHGNVMLLMGGNVNGGRVHGTFPGLATDQLTDGDLAITTDYRDVVAEVVRKRLGNARLSQIFPGYTPTMRGIVN
ncbi:DUF1501 domain-containing protein [bacterium]|nr:MAG: DUF1501 domain-containing protein [bacterium]